MNEAKEWVTGTVEVMIGLQDDGTVEIYFGDMLIDTCENIVELIQTLTDISDKSFYIRCWNQKENSNG